MASEDPVDAKEFPKVVVFMREFTCPSSILHECTPASCHWRCALDVVDELLINPQGLSGEEMDLLLDFRWKLRQCYDGEGVIRLFCDLRRRMEQRHYLAFYRMRRWLENYMVAEVQLATDQPLRFIPLKLNHFCVEAVRRVCLCAALDLNTQLLKPRVRFAFIKGSSIEVDSSPQKPWDVKKVATPN